MEPNSKKRCFKCEAWKPRTEFYRHPQMGDGLLGKCKECTKRDVAQHRRENVRRIREYDNARAKLPHRAARMRRYAKRYREENPDKYRAHRMVGNALRSGKLTKEPCEVCGRTEVHGHHDDYSKPLEVRWLCPEHHAAVHQGELE